MNLRPQEATCFARGCEAFVCGSRVEPSPNWIKDVRFGYIPELDRWCCPAHAALWKRLQTALPMAIQELHAWALLKANVLMGDPAMTILDSCARAATLVTSLREDEALFQ